MFSLLAVNIGDQLMLEPSLAITGAPQFASPGALISIILKNVYVLAGIMLFVLLIVGGISIISSAGGGDAKKTAQGQKAITSALIGFLIIFASYWIIQIIQYITGLEILNPTF
ncbi:hypothetical protein COS55_00130 [Candidatus Shapirobacteria bacterium CG03_land_8_20_14_0_80_40_19]|uniref:Integral membrane protein n=1 Tax=Candidatus Shapirobacteria bacterium CG03_land_8_20_14_0_80_40_19 TaxID=1974880 RepID=A0A2M7BGG1_9BACT|nr:MAG: hypothetical protein COS55_00130 [Candidatus Shapirobacteria bacterium CG03_land_8_20_14_0_80_40_19]